MDSMKLDAVSPLPLEYNSYAEATIAMLLDDSAGLSNTKLLKHFQNVCIVYACLAVKRNAGIVSTEAKYAAAAKGYKDVSVPGFFKWLKNNGIPFNKAWLTFEAMGRSSLKGAPVLFTNGKKLWKRFDKIMRDLKKVYNKVWDSFVEGQPGGSLPSGSQYEDALEYLLNGVYYHCSGSLNDPIDVEDGDDDPLNDADGGGGVGSQDNYEESSPEKLEEGGGGGQEDKEGAEETRESQCDAPGGGGIKEEAVIDNQSNGERTPSEDMKGAEGGYPDRPDHWMHPFLLTYCLIGRPSRSEDPDLGSARKTSGPKDRGGKQKAPSDKTALEATRAYTEVDLSSTAIRMFTGAGEPQSRAQVEKETAAVAAANAQLQSLRAKEVHRGKLVTAVEALSAAVVSRAVLDEEAAARARLADARETKRAKISDLRGKLEFASPGQETMELRAAISAAYSLDDSHFLVKPISAATPPAAGAVPSTLASASESSAAATPAATPGVAALPTSGSTFPADSTPMPTIGIAAPTVLGSTRSASVGAGPTAALPGFKMTPIGDVGVAGIVRV